LQIKSPFHCYQRVDSCNNDSVATNHSNLYGQRTSIDANNAKDANDADNSRGYAADEAKAKAEADKEVGRWDAEVSD
jgi:hypothetical protein